MSDPLGGGKLTPEAMDPLVGYRPFSKLAVGAAILGLISWLPLFGPLLWPVPLAALLAAWWALHQIRLSRGALAGRGAALFGLGLATFFAVAIASLWLTMGFFLERDARRFSRHWLELLLDREPHQAHQLTRMPERRQPLDDQLWEQYRTSEHLRQALETFVTEPLPRHLLASGSQLVIRFVGTEWRSLGLSVQALSHVYAVTHVDDQGEPLTFFVRLVITRSLYSKTGKPTLTVQRYAGGIQPFSSRVMKDEPVSLQ